MGTWHVDVGGDLRLGQISYAYIDGKEVWTSQRRLRLGVEGGAGTVRRQHSYDV